MKRRRHWVPLAAALFVVCSVVLPPARGDSEQEPESVDGPAQSSEPETEVVRLQISLFWGGGARRLWSGALRFESRKVSVPWVWLTDFEDGDLYLRGSRFPATRQRVPAGRVDPTLAEFDRLPGDGDPRTMLGKAAAVALLQTVTAGEADGLCIEVWGPLDAVLDLDLGPGARLSATLGELIAGPVLVSADEQGNVLLAQATDLYRDAPPSVPHLGGTAVRACLHAHSFFSTNGASLGSVVESLRPFARTMWWTDHNIGNRKFILAGDFEDSALALEYWQTSTNSATLLEAGLVEGAQDSAFAYRLMARGAPRSGGLAWIALSKGAGQINAALCTAPRLRWSWKALPRSGTGAPSVGYVLVKFVSGRTIRYLSEQPAEGAGQPIDIVLETSAGTWTREQRDLAADARTLFRDNGTDAFLSAQFGVLCPSETIAGVLFDDLGLDVPDPPEAIRIQERVMGGIMSVRSYVGLEQSAWLGPEGPGALFPHLTALVPAGAAELFPGLDRQPRDAERARFVESIQAAGGCVGTHHMQMDRHYEAFLDARGFGSDLFELGGAWWFLPAYKTDAERSDRDAHGYPDLVTDELYPLLVRWDRMTARGLFLTGYGAPDLHERFDRSSNGWLNRWLTWIITDDDSPASLLRALRSGQAVATDWRTDAVLSLSVDGQPWMGKFVATDRSRHSVQAHVSGAIPGSRLRWIRGALVRDTPSSATGEPGPIGTAGEATFDAASFDTQLEVDTSRGVFVRAELLNPAGYLVAVSNPVVFAPYWPETWAPGRIAFDWQGVSVAQGSRITLSDARVGADGTLELSGTARAEDSALVLRGTGMRLVGGTQGLVESETETAGELRVEGFRAGEFRAVLAFDTPWEAVPTADPLAIPTRKELYLEVKVGDPDSEAGREFAGFGRHEQAGLLLDDLDGSSRTVEASQPASFRLPIPTGERVWLKLRCLGFSKMQGSVTMQGRALGSFSPMSAMTFLIEPTEPGSDEIEERTFAIHLDPLAESTDPDPEEKTPDPEQETPPTWAELQLLRIQLWRGPGVLDY